MTTFLTDKFSLSKRKILDTTGFLSIEDCKLSRVGVFKYYAKDLGDVASHLPPKQVVGVYRPESEVFNKDSIESFANLLVTDDHPNDYVTTKNAKDLSCGFIVDKVRKDGNHMVGNLIITDEGLIKKINQGKSEISNGYDSVLVEDNGEYEGEEYHFVQTTIRGNHIAIVNRGRAGSTCRLSDSDIEETMTKVMIKDSEGVEKELVLDMEDVPQDFVEYIAYLNTCISDYESQKEQALKDYKDKMDAMESAKQEVETLLTDKEASIEELKATSATELELLKASHDKDIQMIKDSMISVEDLDAKVESRSNLLIKAKNLLQDADFTGMSDAEVKRKVIAAKVSTLKDTASELSEETLDTVFAMIVDEAVVTPKVSVLRSKLQDNADIKPEPKKEHPLVVAKANR